MISGFYYMKNKSTTKELNLSSNEKLQFEKPSKFSPKKYTNITPENLKIYTFNAGFKRFNDDLLIIVFDKLINFFAVYSKTSTPSAPIIWDKKNCKKKLKALIVNSGNANAHTGKKGLELIDKYIEHLSKKINCKKSEIIVSSTGVIGEIFNPNKIIYQINKMNNQKNKSLLDAAKSIMTTDTFPKIYHKKIYINKLCINIYGIAKGSGMINPNMGTMLAYLFIDAGIDKNHLKKLIKNNLDSTFNSISVDSDTSTSDTLVLFSLNKFKLNLDKKMFNKLNHGLFDMMKDLSQNVIKDGEGLSKLTEIKVLKAKNQNQAAIIAFSIANSPLVKTAIAGEDANWGRVIMAIGKTQEKINQDKIKVYFGPNLLCSNGFVNAKINLNKINKYMKKNKITITVDLNNGTSSKVVYGNDLTHEYVRINGDYRS